MRVEVIRCRPRKFSLSAWITMALHGMNPLRAESYSLIALRYQSIAHGDRIIDCNNGYSNKIMAEFRKKYMLVGMRYLDPKCEFKDFIELAEEFETRGNKMTSNEIVLSLIETFYDYKIGDKDKYDLVMTDDIVREIEKVS